MQKVQLVIILSVIINVMLRAQQFEVMNGPVSNTNSDSRSVNFIDINADGWDDLFISNGKSTGEKDLLYINDGAGGLLPNTTMDIVLAVNPADGASFADFNNDGFPDAMVSSWHGREDLLYLNDGTGQLDYHGDAGILGGSFAETAAFGDYDNDGYVDILVTNSGNSKKNFLYKNLQNGTFERQINHPLANEDKLSRGAIWGDFNSDGLLDLFVANESNATNDLHFNNEDGTYEKLADETIVTSTRSTMTASWGDIDNDGDLDLFVGNARVFFPQQNQLFINQSGTFEEVTEGDLVTTDNCTYGSSFGDYDNDGDLDIIIANGFCNANLESELYINDGVGNFTKSALVLPENDAVCSFGIANGDINNDGFLDIAVANCNQTNGSGPANKLWINQPNDNHWIKVKLEGVKTNRSAVGAKIYVKATVNSNEIIQLREVSAQTGYAGQNSLVAHFGLGDATVVDEMQIIWPAGDSQMINDIQINQLLFVKESDVSSSTNTTLEKKFSMSIFPNPVGPNVDQLMMTVQNHSSAQMVEITLHDSLGVQKMRKKVYLENGSNELPIEMKLNSGMHVIAVHLNGEKLSKKCLVQ